MNIENENQDQNKSDETKSAKYEAALAGIAEELQKDPNVGKAIDHIIEASDDIDEIQSKLIILLKKYLDSTKIVTNKTTGEKIKFNDEESAHNIAKFTRQLIKKNAEIDPDIAENDNNDGRYSVSKKTKMAIKKALKEFTVYEIYKAMNPKRIAGETKKDNYAHNMMIGGKKRASRYEGGSEADLKSYGKDQIKRIERSI